ncbi:DUF1028 domain-containing protein [Sabulicella glaciei]|uniref:DUF1028 domain-containing protein n=1 Tax=Sabulicella glaciei TaxID=2984948 RepID=A0ABT3NVS7_9PROT|nr:DUF1028 domain-containing protein [Roseococcus sp. MDT2-1-1]MCW8086269.1 DUF1028 domain-containing protein [Roseococcus sp. MDT2-1-1]
MTYSLIGRCARTGAFGAVVTSSSVATAARCIRTGPMGAVATQNFSDPALAPLGLTLLRQGLGAQAVLRLLLESTTAPEHRQVAVVDRHGRCAFHMGESGMPKTGQASGKDCIAMGNLLAEEEVPAAMVSAFAASPEEPLAERLVRALEAGLEAGGEFDDEHGAGLLVHEVHDWPVVDLRVDWDDAPVAALRSLWERYRTQQAAYVSRFLDPREAPAF